MTVCVAALSSNGRSMVCVADKALSYGDYITWDTDTTKIIPLKSKLAVLMVSGGEDASRVVDRLLANEQIGQEIPETIREIEAAYQQCFDEVVEIKFIKQNWLTRDSYTAAISGSGINRHIEHIAEQIANFTLSCDLIVCGYDKFENPFILSVSSPGKVVDVTREGFHAVGSGYEHALARLLMGDHKRASGIPQVLYECFDAKAHAELASTVGYEWDGYVLCSAGCAPVPEEAKPLIDRVWVKHNRSPFEKRKKDDLPPPPINWREKLTDIIGAMMESIGVPYLKGAKVKQPEPPPPKGTKRGRSR